MYFLKNIKGNKMNKMIKLTAITFFGASLIVGGLYAAAAPAARPAAAAHVRNTGCCGIRPGWPVATAIVAGATSGLYNTTTSGLTAATAVLLSAATNVTSAVIAAASASATAVAAAAAAVSKDEKAIKAFAETTLAFYTGIKAVQLGLWATKKTVSCVKSCCGCGGRRVAAPHAHAE